MKEKNFDYDDLSDSLIVSRKSSNEKVNGSAEIGNLILDFTASGKIVNVEIKKISQFLEMIKIKPRILHELIDAQILIKPQKNAIAIFVTLKTSKLEQPIPLAMIPVRKKLSQFA